MKASNIRKLLIINSITSVLFTLFSTVAWYYINKDSDNDGTQISVKDIDVSMDYKIYKANDQYQVIESTNVEDLYLMPYDTVIVEKNVLTTLIIDFEVSGAKVTSREGTMTFTITCSEEDYSEDAISNITNYELVPLRVTQTDPEDIYNTVLDSAPGTKQKFVSGTTKATELEFTINIANYTSLIHDNTLSIFIIIDYDTTLIENFTSSIEVSTEQSGGTLPFANDLTTIEIS